MLFYTERGTLKVSPILIYFLTLCFHHPSDRQPWTARIIFIVLSCCTLSFSCDTDLYCGLLRATGQGVSSCCISSGVNRELIIAGTDEFLFWLLCVRHYSMPFGNKVAHEHPIPTAWGLLRLTAHFQHIREWHLTKQCRVAWKEWWGNEPLNVLKRWAACFIPVPWGRIFSTV